MAHSKHDEAWQNYLTLQDRVAKKNKKYDKRYHCPFCQVAVAKLPRHLEDIKMKMKCAPRCQLQEMRSRRWWRSFVIAATISTTTLLYGLVWGSLKWCTESAATKRQLIVPCSDCLGWFAKPELWKHARRCSAKTPTEQQRKGHVKKRMLLKAASLDTSALFTQVIATMQEDDIYLIVRNDQLLCTYGERMAVKHGHDPNRVHPVPVEGVEKWTFCKSS